MKPEELLVDPDLAKKLKEAGFEHETAWSWVKAGPPGAYFIDFSKPQLFVKKLPAPTFEEVLSALPKTITWDTLAKKYLMVYLDDIVFDDEDNDFMLNDFSVVGLKLSDMAAELWLKLKEKGYINEPKNS